MSIFSKKTHLKLATALFLTLSFSVGYTIAWFQISKNVQDGDDDVNIIGSIQSQYFTGTGTTNDPYIIETPIQLYYFAWLQNLGYYNVPYTEDEVSDYNAMTSEEKTEYLADHDNIVPTTSIIKQVHFKLGNDITSLDMGEIRDSNNQVIQTDYYLPAIGTPQYPFVGYFDGNEKQVKNLTIESAVANTTETPSLYKDEDNYEQHFKVVGFFGVVGSIRSDNKITFEGDSTYTYSSQVNQVTDLFLDNITISATATTNSNDNLLIGLIAGYVNGTISNTYISNSGMDISTNRTALGTGYGPNTINKLSQYSVVGYCRNAYRNTIDTHLINYRQPVDTTDYNDNEFFYEASGEENNWGGSLSMYDFYMTIGAMRGKSRTTFYEKAFNGANGTRTMDYWNNTDGDNNNLPTYSLSLMGETGQTRLNNDAIDSTGNFFQYLAGVDHNQYSYQRQTNQTAYNVPVTSFQVQMNRSGTLRYLRINGTTISADSNASNATTFYYSPDYQCVVYYYNNTTPYYLNITGTSSLAAQSYQSTVWTFNGSTLSGLYNATPYYLMGNYSNRNYNFRPYTSTSGTNYYAPSFINTSSTTITTLPNYSTTEYYTTPLENTYFPLKYFTKYDLDHSITSLKEQYKYGGISEYNTGYIVGGSNNATEFQHQHSDIRVSKYTMENIKNSLQGGTTYSTNKKFDVITRTANSNGYCVINDGMNYGSSLSAISNINGGTLGQSGSQVSKNLKTPDALGLQKYTKSRASLQKVFNNKTTFLYGMHFVKGNIGGGITNTSFPHSYTIPQAYLYENGEPHVYYNYQLLEDSIDFNLATDGVVNFFAGMYFTNNQMLFRLYKINRDSNTKVIQSVYEISKIYQKKVGNAITYYYEYDNGPSGYPRYSIDSTSISNTDSLVFDLDWIRDFKESGAPYNTTSSGSNTYYNCFDKALVYFELPLNAGEYALGPDTQREGGYLLYLDIGANAQKITRITTYQIVEEYERMYQYPVGVAIVNGTTAIPDIKSSCLEIKSNYSGTITYARDSSGNLVITTTNTSNLITEYIGDTLFENLQIGQSDTMSLNNAIQTANPYYQVRTVTRIITYTDYNNVEDAYFVTTIKLIDTTITSNGVAGSTTREFQCGYDVYEPDSNGDIGELIESHPYDPEGATNDDKFFAPEWVEDIFDPTNDDYSGGPYELYYDYDNPGNNNPQDNGTNSIILSFVNPIHDDHNDSSPTITPMDVLFDYQFDDGTGKHITIIVNPEQFDSGDTVSNIYLQYAIQSGTSGYTYIIKDVNGNTISTLYGSSSGSTGRVTISVNN